MKRDFGPFTTDDGGDGLMQICFPDQAPYSATNVEIFLVARIAELEARKEHLEAGLLKIETLDRIINKDGSWEHGQFGQISADAMDEGL